MAVMIVRGLALELRKSGKGRRVRVLVGVVVSEVGSPLFPGYRLGGRLALALSDAKEVVYGVDAVFDLRNYSARFAFVVLPGSRVVVTNGFAPLGPGFRFEFSQGAA